MSVTVKYPPAFDLLADGDLYEEIVAPEVDEAEDAIVKRIRQQGPGIGAFRNTPLQVTSTPAGASVVSTLHFPRTTGKAWGRKNETIVQEMAPHVVLAMAQNIEQEWGAAR